MKLRSIILISLLSLESRAFGQEYAGYQDDYGDEQYGNDGYYSQEPDTLYQDYAEGKQAGAAGGGGMMKNVAIGAAGWFIGSKFHSRRAVKKATKKFSKEHKALYSQYIHDVSAMQQENAQLHAFITQATKQQLADQFLEADYDNNGKVSRAEFEQYKRDYVRKHPEQAGQFPRFEEFDPDHNGMITVSEHEQYYERQGMI